MMNEKCVRSPQFSPHPPHELFLSCVNSIISGWYSCLLESLPAHTTAKSWRLNDLQKPTSCLSAPQQARRGEALVAGRQGARRRDRKSTRLNSSHQIISYAVFCLKKKK